MLRIEQAGPARIERRFDHLCQSGPVVGMHCQGDAILILFMRRIFGESQQGLELR